MSDWLAGRGINTGCPHSRLKLAFAAAIGSLRDRRGRLAFYCIWLAFRHPDIFWASWRKTEWEANYNETPGYLLACRILNG